jgi:hypothetical protein
MVRHYQVNGRRGAAMEQHQQRNGPDGLFRLYFAKGVRLRRRWLFPCDDLPSPESPERHIFPPDFIRPRKTAGLRRTV